MLAKRHFRHFRPSLRPNGFQVFLFTAFLALSSGLASASESFLDNGQVRLGVRLDSGACIDWFSSRTHGQNLINGYDHGRYIQQSYYGGQDGATWAGKPWSWNPVQGGSAGGLPSKLLAFTNNGSTIYAKTMPRRWDTGADATAVVMEEWITLVGNYAHVHYRMAYQGLSDQPPRDQELPAVFADCNLSLLVCYNGSAPWTNGRLSTITPPPKNTSGSITENWAAYVGPSNWGLGVYVPGVDRLTYYRVPGHAGPSGDGCSYFAPIQKMAITSGRVVDYDVYLTVGTPEQMRATFAGIHEANGGS